MGKILVTGAAGYIGSHTLIELLDNTGHEVLALDNYSRSDKSAYDRVRAISKRGFTVVESDLCDYRAIESDKNLKGVTGIIHFAAFKSVPESVKNPMLYYHNNVESLVNILRLCEKRQIKHFIFSSSCSVYGNTTELPVTEETPVQAAESPYGHTKQIGEAMIRFFCGAHPWFRAVLLRYFNPVGAHMSGLNGEVPMGRPDNLVPIITQTAAGKNSLTVFGNDYDTRDGFCIRDYVHVTDIADAHLKALDYISAGKNKSGHEVFNLGTGEGVSVKEVIDAFEKVSGMKLHYKIDDRRAGDVVAVYADNRRAKKELGWNPKYNLDDMMLSAWKWQQRPDNS